MSSRKRTVIFAPDARADFIDIRAHSLQHWGEDQRDRYEAALLRGISSLADFPEIGSRMPRFFPGCRLRHVEHHVLYDRIVGDVIEVVRILHERTDPARHFQR